MSSSNLLKGSRVQFQSEETRVIDSNELLERRRRGKAEAAVSDGSEEQAPPPGEFQSGLNISELTPEELEGLTGDMDEESAVIKAQPETPPEPVYDGPGPEELLAQAREEIDRMKAEAQAQIDEALESASEEGRRKGEEQGYRDGQAKAQAQIDEKERQLEAEYEKRLGELEPELVRHLAGIYEHIFHVELGAYQGLVMQLLESCMQRIEGSGSYIVHVGPDDYPFVSMQKNRLLEVMGNKNASLEVVEDALMKKNECMIEADGGIYDCSLDVQLDALRRQLTLLSYEGGSE